MRRGYLPAPQKEQFSLDSTYSDIVKRGRELFFPDAADEDGTRFWLTDSTGHPLAHFSKESDLSDFFQKANPHLSKLRMYVTYSPSLEVSLYLRMCPRLLHSQLTYHPRAAKATLLGTSSFANIIFFLVAHGIPNCL